MNLKIWPKVNVPYLMNLKMTSSHFCQIIEQIIKFNLNQLVPWNFNLKIEIEGQKKG